MNELKTWENLIEAFRLYREDIFNFIFYKCCKSREFTEDIVQETFEKAWLKRELFKGGSLKNWLFTIAINTAKDKIRSKKWSSNLEDIDEFLQSPKESEEDLLKEHVLKSITKLNVLEREVITLFYIMGYSHKEIAEIHNKNEGNIRVLIHRAFTKLKKIANG